jgi:uncharacterized protein YeaO (DUF488 family)
MSEVLSVDVCRVYDLDQASGFRAFVDRLWPRGVSRRELVVDEWAKDVAPSTELRRWYAHDVRRFDEFARRYIAELRGQPAAVTVARFATIAAAQRLTLVTATSDVTHSAAEVLRQHLLGG